MTYLKHFLAGDKFDLFNVVSKGLKRKKLEQSVRVSGWDTGAEHEGNVRSAHFSNVDLPDVWDSAMQTDSEVSYNHLTGG